MTTAPAPHKLGAITTTGEYRLFAHDAKELDGRLLAVERRQLDDLGAMKARLDKSEFLAALDRVGVRWSFGLRAGRQHLILSYDGFGTPHLEMIPVLAHWFD